MSRQKNIFFICQLFSILIFSAFFISEVSFAQSTSSDCAGKVGYEYTVCTNNLSNQKDKFQISLSANLNAVHFDSTFKVIAHTSAEVKSLKPENLLIDGGEVKEIRKLSKTSFAIIVSPTTDAKKVSLQVEAEALEDINGNKNENASNEVQVRVLYPQQVASSTPTVTIPTTTTTTTTNTTPNTDILSNILSKIIGSSPSCTYTQNGVLITGINLNTTGCAQTNSTNRTNQNPQQQVQYYDCYGQQIPNTQPCPYDPYRAQQQSQQQAYQQQLAQQRYQQGLQQSGQSGNSSGGLGDLMKLLNSRNFGGNNNSINSGNTYTPPAPRIEPAPKTTEQLAAEAEKEKQAKEKAEKEAAEKAKAEAEAKAKLDACKDQACKDAEQKKIDEAKKTTSCDEKNLEVIRDVKIDAECSSSKKLFCMGGCLGPFCGSQGKTYSGMVESGGGEPFYLLIIKYNEQTYAVTVKTKKLDHKPNVGDIVINGPKTAPQFYSTDYKFLGCTSNSSQNMGEGKLCADTAKPEAYPNIQQTVYGYKDTNNVKFNSRACTK